MCAGHGELFLLIELCSILESPKPLECLVYVFLDLMLIFID